MLKKNETRLEKRLQERQEKQIRDENDKVLKKNKAQCVNVD